MHVVTVKEGSDKMGMFKKIWKTGKVTETDEHLQKISQGEKLSLHLRHLDAGSCNGCDFEIAHLSNPIYDIQQYGLDIVASPRHADGVLVTGSVTHNLYEAIKKTYEAVPEPKKVIAVGDCACGKGIIGSNYAQYSSVNEVLPVDIEIPGCPPSPKKIIDTIVRKMSKKSKV